MAQLKQGINGPGKGSVGNVIMYEMYGKTYLRSRPAKYKDKKSEKQLAQRQRLSLAQDLVRAIKELVRITFKDAAVGRSAYHSAVSLNLKEAIGGAYPNQFVDPHNVILSHGDLTAPQKVNAKKTEEGILLEWTTDNLSEGFNQPSDNLIWCMKDLERFGFSDFQITTVKRHQGNVLLPAPKTTNPVELWIIFRSADETKISNTRWVGQI
jgi:hypothetical protein